MPCGEHYFGPNPKPKNKAAKIKKKNNGPNKKSFRAGVIISRIWQSSFLVRVESMGDCKLVIYSAQALNVEKTMQYFQPKIKAWQDFTCNPSRATMAAKALHRTLSPYRKIGKLSFGPFCLGLISSSAHSSS